MLSLRLLTIANMINDNVVVADIGSDHALLACYLVLERDFKKVYAIDNKIGPLDGAVVNVDKYNLHDKVFLKHEDGMRNIEDDVECVVLAGMGHFTITKILNYDIKRTQKLKQIVLQTNNRNHLLRAWLNENGFEVLREVHVFDADKDYFVISTRYTGVVSTVNQYISEYLLERNDQDYLQYLKKRYDHLKEIVVHTRFDELKNEFKEVSQIVKNN